jgi:hypothetical protein
VTQPGFTLQGNAELLACPDGRARVVLVFACGAIQIRMLVEPDQADAFVETVASNVREASAAARRANNGIVVAVVGGSVPLNAEQFRRRPNVRPGP